MVVHLIFRATLHHDLIAARKDANVPATNLAHIIRLWQVAFVIGPGSGVLTPE